MADVDDLFAAVEDAIDAAGQIKVTINEAQAALARFETGQAERWPKPCPSCLWRHECHCAAPSGRSDVGLAQ